MRLDLISSFPTRALLTALLIAIASGCRTPSGNYSIDSRNGDVFASGPEPTIKDSVLGDAVLAGGEVTFSGMTGSDYLGVGGSQTIGGRIHGSVRAAGGEIKFTSHVDRNVSLAGGNIELDSTSVVTKNAYVVGGNVVINGRIGQGLRVAGGSVVINGTIGSDVEITAGQLTIGPGATISGPLRYRVAAKNVSIDKSAHIAGPVTALPGQDFSGIFRTIRIMWAIGFVLAGLCIVAIAPRLAARSVEYLRARPASSVIGGLGWLVIVPIIGACLAVTVVGVPLAILLGFMYAVLCYVGVVMLSVWLGQMLIGEQGNTSRRGVVLGFLAGGLGIGLLCTIPVLGSITWFVATVVGLGAVLHAIREWGDRVAV